MVFNIWEDNRTCIKFNIHIINTTSNNLEGKIKILINNLTNKI